MSEERFDLRRETGWSSPTARDRWRRDGSSSSGGVPPRSPSSPSTTCRIRRQGSAWRSRFLRGAAMDVVAQKAVELGVERLFPVWCARSQISMKRAATRIDHWLRISRQALKQCRRAWSMELMQPLTLVDLLGLAEADHGVVADAGGGTLDQLPPSRERILLIGPEGGFSPEEEGLINDSGWSKLRLGNHVLRAETAAIAGAAILSEADHRLNSTDD